MRNKKLLLILITCLILLSSLVTSCFGTTTESTSRSQTTPTAPASSTLTPPVTSTITVTPQPTTQTPTNGVLNLEDSGPVTLDPATVAESGSMMYVYQIFSGLVRINAELKVVPDIAQSWDISQDGKTYTFHLRHDVKFQNGKAVTAADFKYSWERALNPATQSLTASTYLNDIVGAEDIINGKTTQLSGVKVIDNYTLQVTINAPKSYFIYKMAYPTSFVLDPTNVASGNNWWQHPNGTGPFKLVQWQPNQLLVLQRNDNYYGDKAVLKQINFQLYSGNPVALYQQDKIDVTPIGASYIGWATDPTNPVSKQLHIFQDLSFYYIGFNTTEPPFDDAKVRQAFSYAIDKTRLLTLSTDNMATPAYGILPPDMPGYNANLQGIQYDPAKAKELIAESKYHSVSNLPPIVFTTSGWGNNISGLIGGLIDEWHQNLGVTVTVRQIEPDFYSYALNKEKNNLFDLGWVADYPDPQDFLDILFHTGSQSNNGGYSNPKVDALLDQAASEQDTQKRLSLYQQAEQIIVQDAAVLPLFFGHDYILVKPYVKNYVYSPLGYPILSEVSVQK